METFLTLAAAREAKARRRIGLGRRAQEPGREVPAMTRAELSAVLGHIPEQWRLLFELLAHTGLRISEAIGLTWADVEPVAT